MKLNKIKEIMKIQIPTHYLILYLIWPLRVIHATLQFDEQHWEFLVKQGKVQVYEACGTTIECTPSNFAQLAKPLQHLLSFASFVNLATKRPLVLEVNGSKRKVFGILPLLHGQDSESSITNNSAKLKGICKATFENNKIQQFVLHLTWIGLGLRQMSTEQKLQSFVPSKNAKQSETGTRSQSLVYAKDINALLIFIIENSPRKLV